MKALFINAKTKEVTEVNVSKTYGEIHKLLGVEMIEVAFYIGKDCCYVDEEGRINGTRDYFHYNGQEFAGNGLIVGTSIDTGSDTSCEASLEQMQELITFPEFIHEEWAVTLFDEKGIPMETDLVGNHTVRSVLDFCSLTSKDEQHKIKETLVKIDFANGDILHFMNNLSLSISDNEPVVEVTSF